MLAPILLGIFGVIYFWIKKQWEMMIPLFVIIPSLFYLINPWISSDHPWMLRRFVFSVLPAFILYAVLFLEKWTKEKNSSYKISVSYLAIVSMLLLNLFLFANYFPFSENKSLLVQTEKISENFESNALVLIDSSASGNGWAMISGPMSFLQNKNSAYFFNIEDLNKIDRNKFYKIYLVASDRNAMLYSAKIGADKIVSADDYSIETEKLFTLNGKENLSLPEKLDSKTNGKILELRITN